MRVRSHILGLGIPLVLLFLQCNRSQDSVPPFKEVKVMQEKKVSDLKDKLVRDSTNSDLLAQYATEVLKNVKFDHETSREYYSGYTAPASNRLGDLVGMLTRGVERDSMSARLHVLLGRACIEAISYTSYSSGYRQDLLRENAFWAFKRALELDSTLTDARLDLAELFLAYYYKNVEESRKITHKVLNANPENGKAWYLLWMSYDRYWTQSDSALRLVTKAEKHDLEEPLDYIVLSQFWPVGRGDLYYNGPYLQVVKNIPGAAKGFFFAGANYLLSNRKNRKIDLLKKALDLNPYCLPALIGLFPLEYSRGDFESALSHYLTADEVDSALTPWEWWNLDWDYLDFDFFEKVIQRHPENYRAYIQLGEFHRQGYPYVRRDTAKAIKAYEKAILLRPQQPEPYSHLAACLVGKRLFNEAEVAAEKANQRVVGRKSPYDPWSHSPYLELGEAYAEVGAYERAEKSFLRVLQKPNTEFYEVNQIAYDYKKRQDTIKAKEIYRIYADARKSREIDAKEAGNLASVYEELGDIDQAIFWKNKLLRSLPMEDRIFAREDLASFYSQKGMYDQAIKSLKEGLLERTGLRPSISKKYDAALYLHMGTICVRKKDLRTAEVYFEKAYEYAPKDSWLFFYNAGIAYRDIGKKDEAIRWFKRASEQGNDRADQELKDLEKK